MATMTVMFEVPVCHSGDVMSALAPHMAHVSNFSMEAKQKTTRKRTANRRSRSNEAIFGVLKNGAASTKELEDAMEEVGLKRTSTGPALSKLKSEGAVRWDRTAAAWSMT